LAMRAGVSPDEKRFVMPTLMPISSTPILHGVGMAHFELPHWESPNPVSAAPTGVWPT
jgi:hypothetical protein